MVRKQQLFSVRREIVPYKKFKKRGGEPFFKCILGGAYTLSARLKLSAGSASEHSEAGRPDGQFQSGRTMFAHLT